MFHLDSILEMYKEEQQYGVVFITGSSYGLYLVKKSGDHLNYKKLDGDEVTLQRRHNKGGQSSVRFSRLRDESEANFVNKVAELIIKYFIINVETKGCNPEEETLIILRRKQNAEERNTFNTVNSIDMLIIAGSGSKKTLLSQNCLIEKYFKNKTFLKNTPNLNDGVIDQIIKETVSELDNLKNEHIYSDVVNDIKNMMSDETQIDKLCFGLKEIKKNLENNMLNEIIISNTFGFEYENNNRVKVTRLPDYKLNELGVDIIGVKYY